MLILFCFAGVIHSDWSSMSLNTLIAGCDLLSSLILPCFLRDCTSMVFSKQPPSQTWGQRSKHNSLSTTAWATSNDSFECCLLYLYVLLWLCRDVFLGWLCWLVFNQYRLQCAVRCIGHIGAGEGKISIPSSWRLHATMHNQPRTLTLEINIWLQPLFCDNQSLRDLCKGNYKGSTGIVGWA